MALTSPHARDLDQVLEGLAGPHVAPREAIRQREEALDQALAGRVVAEAAVPLKESPLDLAAGVRAAVPTSRLRVRPGRSVM